MAQSRSTPTIVGGVVTDASGAAAAGATVTLTSAGREQQRLTDASGRFSFGEVSDPRAAVLVTLDKFAPAVIDDLAAQDELKIVLQPAQISEDIHVSGTPGRIRTATRTETALRDVPQAVTV